MVAAMESTARAFWSYAHIDDDREHGRILRLAKLVREEYETLTGTTIQIFTDRDQIGWGDDFRTKLDEALQKTAFFIPVLTPTYFLREECRKEMSQFVRSASALGLQQLMLSLRYIPVPDMSESSTDELKSVAAKMQYEPWEFLRLEDEGSAVHRKAVNQLATRLVTLTMSLETTSQAARPAGALGVTDATLSQSTELHIDIKPGDSAPPLQNKESASQSPQKQPDFLVGHDDSEPGLIDRVADIEPAMASWADTLQELTGVNERVNTKFSAATGRMQKSNGQPNAFAQRILIARELATDVEPELQEMEELSRSYSAGLIRLDASIRAMFSLAEFSEDNGMNRAIAPFRTSMAELVSQAKGAMDGLEHAASSAQKLGGLSRDLRPVLRRYETATRNIIDGFSIIEEWESM